MELTARVYRVCPFELSLDAAAWADAVIGDYNYVFDPVTRLKRLDNERFRRIALIVDEAHQLGDRVRDMLGMVLRRSVVKAALRRGGLAGNACQGFAVRGPRLGQGWSQTCRRTSTTRSGKSHGRRRSNAPSTGSWLLSRKPAWNPTRCPP